MAKKIAKAKTLAIFLSPLDRGGAGNLAFAIANLEEGEIIALLVADGEFLAQAALLGKVNIEAEWSAIGQILNR